jgi:hypothetical protein
LRIRPLPSRPPSRLPRLVESRWLLVCGGCLLVALAGACAEPPTKERHQADGALAAARAADAATYAPVPLQAAEEALKHYDEAVARGDYRLALNHAIDARDRAYEAAKQASNDKAAARSQAERLATEFEVLFKRAEAKLAGAAGPRPMGASADRLRSITRSGPSLLQEARTHLAKQDYRGTIKLLTPPVEALRRELAAPPPVPPRRGR